MSWLSAINRISTRPYISLINRRLVSTSPKSKSNETATADECEPKPSGSRGESAAKSWISYGYDKCSKEADRNAAHSGMFGTVTICLVLGGLFFAYMPDYNLRDWATREAFLELRRREQAGLPLIDPNLIDPSKIKLPSDEELGDTELIV